MSYNTDLQSNNEELEEILRAVNELPEADSGEPVLQEKSVTPTTSQQEVTPDSGYDGLSKVTVGAMQTAEQATPIVSVDSEGKITASATQSEGYVSAGTKSATKQLTTQAATTYTPGTADQTIAAGTYLTGTQTIKGDANLLPENIKKGVTIFGKVGTHEGSGGGSGSGNNLVSVTVDVTSEKRSAEIWYIADGGVFTQETVNYGGLTVYAIGGIVLSGYNYFKLYFAECLGNAADVYVYYCEEDSEVILIGEYIEDDIPLA